MPEVSLTSFTDFVLANGQSKVTKVANIMDQLDEDYSPARDFYRGAREAIIAHHEGESDALDDCLDKADKRRLENYTDVISGYRNFLRRHKPSNSQYSSRTAYWEHGGLTVTVNPELRLVLPDGDHFIKLYFKSDKVSLQRADVILYLMRNSLPTRRASVALLDVREARLFQYRMTRIPMAAYLAGEAAAFSEMWRQLEADKP